MKLNKTELKNGDVLHCTSNRLLPKIIQKFTKSTITHTAIVIKIWDKIFIIDSQKDGVNLRPLEKWNKKFNYSYKVSRPKYFTIKIRDKALSKIGFTSYDFASLIIWQPLYLLTGKWKGHTRKSAADKMYCSEFVAWVYNLKNWWELSPHAVYDVLLNDKRFKLIK